MKFLHNYYSQPMENVYIEAIAMYVLWLIAMFVLRDKARRIISVIGLILSIVLILLFTVSGRKSGSYDISLIPFISFENAKTNTELYRSMFMNLLLFMPLGLCMPFALPKKVKIKGLLTIGAGMVLSIAIEAIQFFFSLGRCETDDVIMNTTGVIIGTSVYLFFFLVHTIKRKRRMK